MRSHASHGILQNVVPVSLPPAKAPLVRFGIAVTEQKACAPCTNVSDELGRGLYGKYMPLIRIQAPQRYHWINTAPRINVDWLRVQAPTLLFSAL